MALYLRSQFGNHVCDVEIEKPDVDDLSGFNDSSLLQIRNSAE